MPASDEQEGGSDTFKVTMDLPGPVSLWANLESELGSQMVEPTVDTGACVSMISHALWWHSGCSKLTGAALPVLYDANGQLLDVSGQTMVYLEMDGRPYRSLMYIVRGLGTDMLLGADFLRATGACLDFGDMTAALNGNRPIALYLAEHTG